MTTISYFPSTSDNGSVLKNWPVPPDNQTIIGLSFFSPASINLVSVKSNFLLHFGSLQGTISEKLKFGLSIIKKINNNFLINK